jgi:type III secretion protein J
MRKWIFVFFAGVFAGCTTSPIPLEENRREELTDIVGQGLLPSPADEHLRREHALARELANTLERLDGVLEARLHLNLPALSPLERSKVFHPKAAALLVVESQEVSPDLAQVRRLLAAALPGLSPEHVEIEVSVSSRKKQKLVSIGPVMVAEESAFLAKAISGGLLALVLLLGAALCAMGFRRGPSISLDRRPF